MAERTDAAEAAYEQGMEAYRAGSYEQAVPALETAADAGLVEARFFLARIRADDSRAYLNHVKAYRLYLAIVDEFATIDRSDISAPFVSKSLIALAHYLRRGLPEAGVAVNLPRALQYLEHAAKYFGDADAQFEIAKLYLHGEGLPKDTELARHWLSTLTQDGHPGAQAVLADLFWRGELVARDPVRALGLILLSVEQAPETDQFWIAQTYQNIYCGSDAATRLKAEAFASFWRPRFGRIAGATRDSTGIHSGPTLSATRTCGDGEVVPPRALPQVDRTTGQPDSSVRAGSAPPLATAPQNVTGARPGRFMLRETGAESPRQ
jgi:TPR repeat protein